jgi:predicted DNA-binding transcriptional regulator AlpA
MISTGMITVDDARVALATWDGLGSQADLAARWGVTRQRVWQLVREAGFPAPVGRVNGQAVWLVGEADDWRKDRTSHRTEAPTAV